MEDRKVLYITGIVIITLLVVVLVGALLFFQFQKSPPQASTPETETQSPQAFLPGLLPSTDSDKTAEQKAQALSRELAKERQFISSFWQPKTLEQKPQAATYELPISDIKEQAANYRDFSRKVNLDSALETLSSNGFVVIANPFNDATIDWETSYRLLQEREVPLFITADSVIGVYQTTLQTVYKEIEQEIFYRSLWDLLHTLQQQVRQRYEARRSEFGIQTDLLTEANRLELGYLSVALTLLKPDANQVKETLTTGSGFFTPAEAQNFNIVIPEYLENEVAREVDLMSKRTPSAPSPILLYDKSYTHYNIPPAYRSSEKLKNYYLTITWLADAIFPLWHTQNNCDNCLLDQSDHAINFVAALLLSNDLARNQDLKNQWANIYKSVSFFRGLESNLTYLDYHRALVETFGDDYHLEELFAAESEVAEERISLLQQRLAAFEFPASLGGRNETKSSAGLRLLRNYHLLENKLFASLITPQTGAALFTVDANNPRPFTACPHGQKPARCLPTALDLWSLLGNQTAKKILAQTSNDAYDQYQKNHQAFTQELSTFDQNTWHDNAYMGLLRSLTLLVEAAPSGFPTFMQTPAWDDKTLNTSLGAWLTFHQDFVLEKTDVRDQSGLPSYFPYGYIEPQAAFYAELLSNIEMIIDGFTALQIIGRQSKSYERLDNLKLTLEQLLMISQKELAGNELDSADYTFINNFTKHIRSFIGDIAKENIKNQFEKTFGFNDQRLRQRLTGLSYAVVVYPAPSGELFLAVGPVIDYRELNDQNKPIASWQESYQP